MSSYYETVKGEILFCLEKFQLSYILIIYWHAMLELFLTKLAEKRDLIFLR